MNTIEKIHLYGFRDADYLWDIVEKNSSIQNYRNQDSNRLCIILSNTDLFCYATCTNYDDLRIGDTLDRIGLILAFIKLNYKVEIICDETAVTIKNYFEQLKLDNRLEQYESITLFILSHGNKNGIISGSDGQRISIMNDIINKLNESKYLENKEKVIFLNACRGGKT